MWGDRKVEYVMSEPRNEQDVEDDKNETRG